MHDLLFAYVASISLRLVSDIFRRCKVPSSRMTSISPLVYDGEILLWSRDRLNDRGGGDVGESMEVGELDKMNLLLLFLLSEFCLEDEAMSLHLD